MALGLGAEAHQRRESRVAAPCRATPCPAATAGGFGSFSAHRPGTPQEGGPLVAPPAPPPSAAPRSAGRSRPRRTCPASAPRSRLPAARRCPGPAPDRVGRTISSGRAATAGFVRARARPHVPPPLEPGRLVSGTRSATSRNSTPSAGGTAGIGRHGHDTSHGPRASPPGPRSSGVGAAAPIVVELDRERDESLRQQRQRAEAPPRGPPPAGLAAGFPRLAGRAAGRRSEAGGFRAGRRGTIRTVAARPRPPRPGRPGPGWHGRRPGHRGWDPGWPGWSSAPGRAPRRRRACRAPGVQAGGGRARAAPRPGP